jgi:hypothetical protein
MRLRDKSGGKAVKAERRKTLTRRSALKASRNPLATDQETNVAGLTRELFDAREQQMATAEILRVIRSPFRFWPDCIINTSGYDFRKGQGTETTSWMKVDQPVTFFHRDFNVT